MKWRFIVLATLGFFLPLSQFVPWLMQYGIDPARFLSDLFSNNIGGFFGMDVFVSAVVTLGLISLEGRRLQMTGLIYPVIGTVTVGVSFGLPLFLAMREHRLNREVGHGVA